MTVLASVLHKATLTAVWLIVIALALVLLDANQSNEVVKGMADAGSWLTGPFHGVFDVGAHRADLAADWGMAAFVYGVVGGMLNRFLVAAADRGRIARTTVLR